MIPIHIHNFIVRVCTAGRQEIPTLRDILFTLLSANLNLLLFTTTPEVILLQGTFGFVG